MITVLLISFNNTPFSTIISEQSITIKCVCLTLQFLLSTLLYKAKVHFFIIIIQEQSQIRAENKALCKFQNSFPIKIRNKTLNPYKSFQIIPCHLHTELVVYLKDNVSSNILQKSMQQKACISHLQILIFW